MFKTSFWMPEKGLKGNIIQLCVQAYSTFTADTNMAGMPTMEKRVENLICVLCFDSLIPLSHFHSLLVLPYWLIVVTTLSAAPIFPWFQQTGHAALQWQMFPGKDSGSGGVSWGYVTRDTASGNEKNDQNLFSCQQSWWICFWWIEVLKGSTFWC